MVPQLVTQLDLDAPLVVVVGTPSTLRSEVVRVIGEMGLQTIVSSVEDFAAGVSFETLSEAYKVVWIVDALDYFSPEVEQVNTTLASFSKKTIILQPVIDGTHSPSDSVLATTWRKITELQESVILDINSNFSDSLFVFAQNVFGSSLFPLDILLLHEDKNVLYDPDYELSLLTIEAFVAQAVPVFFRPSPQHSFCFVGDAVHSSHLVEEVSRLLSSYYQKNVVAKHENIKVGLHLPFRVSEKKIEHVSALSIADSYVRKHAHGTSKLARFAPAITLKTPATPAPAPKVVSPQPASESASKNTAIYEEQPVETSPVQSEESNPVPETKSTSSAPVNSKVEEKTQAVAEEKQPEKPKKNVDDDLDINQEISRIFKQPRTAGKVARVEKMAHTELKHTSKSKRKRVLFYGGLGFIGIGFGVVVLLLFFVTTQFLVKRQLFAVAKATVQESVSDSDWSRLQQLASLLEVQTKSYGSLFDLAIVSDSEHILDVTTQLSDVTYLLEDMEASTQLLYYRLLGQEEGSVFEVSAQLASAAETAYENLSLVQAGLEQITFSENDAQKQEIVSSYQGKIDDMREGLITQRQVLPLMKDLFGGTKKTYLVLFQNEQELRPTGGFIQAAAVVTFSEGRLISSQVFSSYDVDSLVSGTVAPPDDLPRFLGEQQWYFRDSNWNPDFTQSAAKASWFMSKAAGGKIDGVMALTLDSTGDLIDSLGPLEIVEHNEVVTSKNLDALMEHHSEKVLLNNSDEKDYPVLIMEKLLEKIKTAQPEKIDGFLAAVHTNLEEKDLLITSTDDVVEDLFSTLGWNGSLVKPECPIQFSSEVCTVDTIAQVAANTGVNKANYYLEEEIDHTVELLPGVAQHTRIIRIENTADINAWPKGDYRAYYRFYLNANAEVSEVTINNQKVGKDQMIERIEQGRSMVGFLVTVPIQAQTEVVFKYSVPLSGEAGYSYAFFDQKQPGTDIPTTVTVVPYSGLKPAKIAPQAEVTPGGIVFETEHRKSHGFYGVEFR